MKNKDKISEILSSLMESKKEYKFLILLNENDEEVLKLKTDAKERNFIDLLDKVFDMGYKVKQISKEEFEKN